MVKSKGFVPPRRTVTIKGADVYVGMEADLRLSMPLGMALNFADRMQARIECGSCDGTGVQGEEECSPCDGKGKVTDGATISLAFKEWGDCSIVSWNIEKEDGTPVPANGEGLLTQDDEFMKALFEAWSEGRKATAKPKAKPTPIKAKR